MKCERCGNIEAIFHLTEVAGETLTQRHLCRACAQAEGHDVPPPHYPTEWTALAGLHREPS